MKGLVPKLKRAAEELALVALSFAACTLRALSRLLPAMPDDSRPSEIQPAEERTAAICRCPPGTCFHGPEDFLLDIPHSETLPLPEPRERM